MAMKKLIDARVVGSALHKALRARRARSRGVALVWNMAHSSGVAWSDYAGMVADNLDSIFDTVDATLVVKRAAYDLGLLAEQPPYDAKSQHEQAALAIALQFLEESDWVAMGDALFEV